jgi:hypothetical protein
LEGLFWVCFWMVVCARLRPVIPRLMGGRLVRDVWRGGPHVFGVSHRRNQFTVPHHGTLIWQQRHEELLGPVRFRDFYEPGWAYWTKCLKFGEVLFPPVCQYESV